ncbi:MULTISPECIES: CPBP family intramembrane glutamic endopeptidase [Vagococcus]|nr:MULTISPECIES: type II CAAX endopeptidase family protein [Vagococcus]RHH70988.1 CPBP family intramembrane metalloprotease [Vagococcus sp. AM17-17]
MKKFVVFIKKVGLYIVGLLIILGMLLLNDVPTLVLNLFEPIFNKKSNGVSIILFLCWLVILGAIIWFIWRFYQNKSHDTDISLSKKDIWRAFKIFLIGRVIVFIGTGLMQLIYGDAQSANDDAIAQLFGPNQTIYYVLIMTIIVAVKAPILEELIFRGLPTTLLFKNMPYWVPMILTSLAFSAVHLSSNIISFAMYAALGALMYWAYCSRGRIVDSMMVHFFNNILGAIMLLLSYLFGLPLS